jgi:hypothetical protein
MRPLPAVRSLATAGCAQAGKFSIVQGKILNSHLQMRSSREETWFPYLILVTYVYLHCIVVKCPRTVELKALADADEGHKTGILSSAQLRSPQRHAHALRGHDVGDARGLTPEPRHPGHEIPRTLRARTIYMLTRCEYLHRN